MEGEPWQVIEMDSEPATLERLQSACDLGLVAQFSFADGSERSGVMIGVSSTSLIVDRWDEQLHRAAGDPLVLDLASITRIVIP